MFLRGNPKGDFMLKLSTWLYSGLILFMAAMPASAEPRWWDDLLSDEYEECFSDAGTTRGFRNCAWEEYERQNALLEEVYARLVARLKEIGNEAAIPLLEESQRAWKEYRELEDKYITDTEGTIWPQLGSKWAAAFTVLRIREFENIMTPTKDGLGAWQKAN